MVSSKYPRDEFDIAGEDMPVGMHRPQPSHWKFVWPFLVILILIPLLAWGASALLLNREGQELNTVPESAESSESAQSAQSTQSDDDAQSVTIEPAQSEPETVVEPAQPEPEAAPAQEVNYNATIDVLNGTGTAGLAAERAGTLNGAGFANTTPANADDWITEVSFVYYADSAFEATAQEVARVLGITNVKQIDATGGGNIVVVLK